MGEIEIAVNNFNDYFGALFRHSRQNCLLLMDAEGTILEFNKAVTLIFGYSQADLIGKNMSVLFTEEDRSNGRPEKEIQTVLERGQCYDNNYFVNADATTTWVAGESIRTKSPDGNIRILKVIQDIHQRKDSELELRRLNEFNEKILSSIADAVLVVDENKKIKKFNNAFVDLFKYNPEQLANLNFEDIIRPYDFNGALLQTINKTINTQNGFSNKQIEIETSPEEKRIFEVSGNVIHSQNENNLLLIIHDVTIYKQLEREREDVMGFVAHELRNPLSNVILCNDLMGEAIRHQDLGSLSEILQRSKNNVDRLQRLIAELYESTKVSSGYLPMEFTVFNFSEVIMDSINTIEVLQPAYQITTKGSGDIMINGDRYRLIQVITNYLSNGIKYSTDKTEVTLTIEHDNNTLTVSVSDEGRGISKDQLPFVFERFFRVEKTRNIEGIGLGLYLCRQIIQAHRGRVWAESEEGVGSTFYFSIPIHH